MTTHRLGLPLAALLMVSAPTGLSAQSLGASNGLQIRADAGKTDSITQLYIRQRGLGWSNLAGSIQFSEVTPGAPANLIDLPVPSIQAPLPDDFRLSITNTDQLQTTHLGTTSAVTVITLTNTPLNSPTR